MRDTESRMVTSVDVDTVITSLYGSFDSSVIEALSSFRDQAKLYGSDFPCSGDLSGWSIRPFGAPSKGFSFILLKDDIRVLISKGPGTDSPNFRLEIGSVSCHSQHLPTLSAEIQSVFQFDLREEKLTRADLCRDVECDFGSLSSLVSSPRFWYWNRRLDFSPYYEGDRFTGVQLGKGDILLRLYDKTYKLLKDKNKYKHKLDFYSNYYGLDLSKSVVFRLEGQFRRQYLRSVAVDTLDQFLSKKDEIWAYLTEKWAFLSDSEVTRSNGHGSSSAAPFHHLWSLYLVENEPVVRESPRRSSSVSDRIFKQGFGCIMSYVMAESDTRNLHSLFEEMLYYFEEFVNGQLKLALSPDSGRNRYERRLLNYRNLNSAVCEVPF